MNKLARFFIENAKLTLVLTMFCVIFGLMGLSKLNSEEAPAVNFAIAVIDTSYPGASAEDIETKITKPLEDEIRGVSGLKDVKSVSKSGNSSIVVRIDMDNEDEDVVMDDLQKAVNRVSDLPADLPEAPFFKELKASEFPVLDLAVLGPNDQRQRDAVVDLFKDELEDNKDILSIDLVGFSDREFQIMLDPKKLSQYYIGIEEVMAKVDARNRNIPGGSLKSSVYQNLVRVEGKIENKKDLENIVIRSNFSGQRILLKDIANVVDGKKEITILTSYNGQEATLVSVKKKSGADIISMNKGILKTVERFQKKYKGKFKFVVTNDASEKVVNKIDLLKSNALSGLVLVVLFLFIFLPGKIGLVASLSLPLAILTTFGFMPYFGMTINTITVLALVIALGMLVDNSVVLSENFSRLREEGKDAKSAAVETISSLWLPITATAMTTIAAFLPMLVTKGIMGQFIKGIPIVVSFALLLSLFEGFFLLPMRLVAFGKGKLRRKKDNGSGDWFKRYEQGFKKMMGTLVRRRYLVSIGFLGMLLISFGFMGIGNQFQLFPAEETELYTVRVELKKGTPVETTQETIQKISNELIDRYGDQVKYITAYSGQSSMGMDAKGGVSNNLALILIYVNDETKYNVPSTVMLDKFRKFRPDYVESITYECEVHGPPVGYAVEATFRSNDDASLNSLIGKVTTDLSKVDGILNVGVDELIGDDEVFIHVNYQEAAALGLDIAKIGTAIRTGIAGIPISRVTLSNKDVDIRIQMNAKSRKNIVDLQSVKIMNSRGNLIPLHKFATYKVRPGTPQVKRFDFKRSKTVTADIVEDKITSIRANMELKRIFEKYRGEHDEVSLVFGGMAESTNESMQSLFEALILSLIGIFALLVFVFKSFLRPLIIMTTIPLGLVGFSIAFFAHGRPISFMAMIGIVALGGIIVNSGIVLISFIDEMRQNSSKNLFDILAEASGMRLRAVLVTSLTTVVGLFPTAYGIGGSDATLVPMTLAMAWGLTSGTILTLIWVPCAYAILEDVATFSSKFVSKIFSNSTDTDPHDDQLLEADESLCAEQV